MNIIITDTFKKDFLKIFKLKDLDLFSQQIQYSKSITLKEPYQKYKFYISGIAIRGVFIVLVQDHYLPIFIVKKSDKNYGNNLILSKELIKILSLKYQKAIEDIKNKKHIILE